MVSATRAKAEWAAIDPLIQRLLVQAINSPLNLHLALLFHENPRLEGSARQITDRIYRDVWSTREALRELAQDGILGVSGAGEPVYSYRPCAEHHVPIARLVERFNDPFARDQIYTQLHDLARDTLYRHSLTQGMEDATTCPCCRP